MTISYFWCLLVKSVKDLIEFEVLPTVIGRGGASTPALVTLITIACIVATATAGGEPAEHVLQDGFDGVALVGFVWTFRVDGLQLRGVIVAGSTGKGVFATVVRVRGDDVSYNRNGFFVREVVFVDGGSVVDGVEVRVVSKAFMYVGFWQFGGVLFWLVFGGGEDGRGVIIYTRVGWIIFAAVGFLFFKLANAFFRVKASSFGNGALVLVKQFKVLVFFVLHFGQLFTNAIVVAAVAVAADLTWTVVLVYGQLSV